MLKTLPPHSGTDETTDIAEEKTEPLKEDLEARVLALLDLIGSGQDGAQYNGLLERQDIGHTEYVEFDARGVRASLHPADSFEGAFGRRGRMTSSDED